MDLFGVNSSLHRVTKQMIFKDDTHILVGGFNPFEKYWSKWESSANRGGNKIFLKPPPSIWSLAKLIRGTGWPAGSRSGVTPVLGTSHTYCHGPLHLQNLLGHRPTELASCSQCCACSYVWSSLQMVCERNLHHLLGDRWVIELKKKQMPIRNVQNHNQVSSLQNLDDIPLYWLLKNGILISWCIK